MSTSNPLSKKFGKALRALRRKQRLSVNALARVTGLSRRSLERIESGRHAASGRILGRLLKALLPPGVFDATLAEATRPIEPYDVLPDLYPAFLFHQAPPEYAERFRREFGADYRQAFQQMFRLRLAHAHLPRRLRAFRLEHDLTLTETAALLDISKSQVQRLERGERQGSPRTRYRLLRLLTLPVPPRAAGPEFLRFATLLLALPPPPPLEEDGEADAVARLRHQWLSGSLPTRALAAELGVSEVHLIRLLHGERQPSRKLREKIAGLVGGEEAET
ncbi:MAG: helix-turn-helix domain-containing protein [Candidatus Acidiferrales bacterium]